MGAFFFLTSVTFFSIIESLVSSQLIHAWLMDFFDEDEELILPLSRERELLQHPDRRALIESFTESQPGSQSYEDLMWGNFTWFTYGFVPF